MEMNEATDLSPDQQLIGKVDKSKTSPPAKIRGHYYLLNGSLCYDVSLLDDHMYSHKP